MSKRASWLKKKPVGSALVDLVVAERKPEAEAKRKTQLNIMHDLAIQPVMKLSASS